MAGPRWLDAVLAAVMVLSALVHGGRLLRASRTRETAPARMDVDVAHVAMSTAMATMLTVGLGAGASLVCAAAFVPLTCYFVARASQSLTAPQAAARSRLAGAAAPVRHATGGFAMVFMLVTGAGLAVTAGSVPSGHVHTALAASTSLTSAGPVASSSTPGPVSVVLVGLLLGTALWQLAGARRPSLREGCQVTMGLTMAYMLVVMA
ncbi:DUF5134 domain-containing protein [Angustibacter luteus]|uniref:DUF5134 domain-containing protein n=1 Tax=Angustibacter luteus TaxID=658456 RepID=A0ABW1JAH5_9ACTN